MSKLGLGIVILIFGSTVALIAFIVYTILWDSSPVDLILPLTKMLFNW